MSTACEGQITRNLDQYHLRRGVGIKPELARTHFKFPFFTQDISVHIIDAAEPTLLAISDDIEVVTIRMGRMNIDQRDWLVFVPEQYFVDFDMYRKVGGLALTIPDGILAQATLVNYKPLNKFELSDVRGQDIKASDEEHRVIHRNLIADMNNYYDGIRPEDDFTALGFTRLSPRTQITLFADNTKTIDVFKYVEPLRTGMKAKLPLRSSRL